MTGSNLEQSRPAPSWGRVWLFSALAPLAAGVLWSVAFQMWRDAVSDSYSADGWASGLPGFIVIGAIVASITALFFVFMVRIAEHRVPKPLLIWLALGFVAATPIALGVVGFVAVSPFDRVDRSASLYAAQLIFFYTAGLIGTLTAWRVRRGGWRA